MQKFRVGLAGVGAVLLLLVWHSIERWSALEPVLAKLRSLGPRASTLVNVLDSPLLPLGIAIAAIVLILEGHREITEAKTKNERSEGAVSVRDGLPPSFQANSSVHVHFRQVKSSAPSPPPKLAEAEPNLVLNPKLSIGPLYLLNDYWSRTAPLTDWRRSVPLQAIYAEIKNRQSENRTVGAIAGVRAELVIDDDAFSPLSWLDTDYNLVNFEFSAVKYVVLAVEMEGRERGDWRIPINHRDYGYAEGVGSITFDHVLKRGVQNAKLKLNLLHVKGGKTLSSFGGTYRWKSGERMPWMSFPLGAAC